jgi:hypothetical protein
MMGDLEEEIRALEERIARERSELVRLLEDWGDTLRDTVARPKNLFAVAALGFVLGEALRPGRPATKTHRRGIGGLLTGAALALVRARYGSPWTLARQFWSQASHHSPRAAWPPKRGIVSDDRTGPASDLSQRATG